MGFLIREPQTEEIDTSKPIYDLSNRKQCPCGKMFTPYRSYQRYHNDACRVKFEAKRPSRYIKRPIEDKECPQCGKTFRTNDGKKVYCTNECYLAHEAARHVTPTIRTCKQCGREFLSAHALKEYCSIVCRKEARQCRKK